MFPIFSKENRLVQLILHHKRFLIFSTVGGINTGVDFAVFKAIYLATPLPAPFCQAISYTAGVICSFILNRHITFRDGERSKLTQEMGWFLAVNAVSLSTSVVGMYLLTELADVSTLLSKVLVTILTGFMNYFGFKIFVFRVKE